MTSRKPSELNELAERLDAALPPGSSTTPAHDSDPLVDLAARLARGPHPQLSDSAQRRIEARMMKATKPSPLQSKIITLKPLIRALNIAASIMLIFMIGLTPVAANSLPGDTLYSAKLAYERFELAAADLLDDKATVYLRHAARRIAEAERLLDRGQFSFELVARALDNMTVASAAAGMNGVVDELYVERLVRVNAELDVLLVTAANADFGMDIAFDSALTLIQTTRASGVMPLPHGSRLLPALVEPTSAPTLTLAPTQTNTPTSTHTSTATNTPTNTNVPASTQMPTNIPINTPLPQQAQPTSPPGQGSGPPADPPGQGGSPPGQGGSPPVDPPGHGGSPPGQGSSPPVDPPGHGGSPPGQGSNPPVDPPGHGGSPPGQGSGPPSNPPGRGGN